MNFRRFKPVELLFSFPPLRKLGLRLLKFFSSNMTIDHHWVPSQRILLNSFKHKGYWWHGKNREYDAMLACAQLITSGNTVIEVGSHIGYLTSYFAHLTGTEGRVIAFEPSEENATYLAKNTERLNQVSIDRRGLSNYSGTASFFVEPLTGQNNSLHHDYAVLDENAARAGTAAERAEIQIEVTTLDAFCSEQNITPHFIKIDVEGAELEALQGMHMVLTQSRPVVMIELTRETRKCVDMLRQHDYVALDESLSETWVSIDEKHQRGADLNGNYFFVPSEKLV
jgi:FkbM family methyltransferase